MIEANYPSRRQSRATNPLFARERRIKSFCVMAVLTVAGLGLVTTQVMPLGAQAHDAPSPAAAKTAASVVQKPVAPKSVRVIPLYSLPVQLSAAGQ